jgi:hypothetical protein
VDRPLTAIAVFFVRAIVEDLLSWVHPWATAAQVEKREPLADAVGIEPVSTKVVVFLPG